MSFPTGTGYVAVLNQQQQQNTYHYNHSNDAAAVSDAQAKSKNCTIVENGRVVVKPLQTLLNEAEETE